MTYNTLFLSLAFIITAFPLKAKVNTFMLRQLKTEYMSCPIGLDTNSPRFSWQMSAVSRQRGLKQKAFCIQVFNEQDKEIWNTGKCISPESLNIIYKGATLQPMTRYKWKVKVWDEKGISVTDSSYFETGLMSSIPYQNWSNARWIGGGKEDLPLYANYLPVFKLNLNFKLNEKTHSTQAGFVYGANDPRLMDANKNIYNLTNAKDKSYIKIVIDTSPLDSDKPAVIQVFRKGYSPKDTATTPLKIINIPFNILDKNNRYNTHSLSVSSNQGNTDFYMRNTKIGNVAMNPIGQGGDFLAFPVVGEVGFALEQG